MNNNIFEKYLTDLKKNKEEKYIVEISNNFETQENNLQTFNSFLKKIEEVNLNSVFKNVVKDEDDDEEMEMKNIKLSKSSKIQKINKSFYKVLLNPPDTLEKLKNIDFEEGIEATNRNFILYLWDIGNQKAFNTFFNNLIGKNNLIEINAIEKEDPAKIIKLSMNFLIYIKKWANFLYNLIKTNLSIINVIVGQKTNIFLKKTNIKTNNQQNINKQDTQQQVNQQNIQQQTNQQNINKQDTQQQVNQQNTQQQTNKQNINKQDTQQQTSQQNTENLDNRLKEQTEILNTLKTLDKNIKEIKEKYENNEITKTYFVLQKKYLENIQKKFFYLLEAIQTENLLKETNNFVLKNVSQLVNDKEVQNAALITSYQFVEQFDEILMNEITNIPEQFSFNEKSEEFFNMLKNDKNFSKSYYIVYYCIFFLKNLNFLMALINKQKFLIAPIIYMAVFEELLKHKFIKIIKNDSLNIKKYLNTIIGTNKKLKNAIKKLDIDFLEEISSDEEENYYLDNNLSVIRNVLIHIKKNVILKNKFNVYETNKSFTQEIISKGIRKIQERISNLLHLIIDEKEVKIGNKIIPKELINNLYDLIFNYFLEEYIILNKEKSKKKTIMNEKFNELYKIIKYLENNKILINYLIEVFKEAKADSKKKDELELDLIRWLKS